MLRHELKIRVRYGETDKMGFVYYGFYALYYESGRTELMRHFGFAYSEMEAKGIMLPVISMEAKYRKPCRYDDFITIVTTVEALPLARIRFDYEILDEAGEVLNTGNTTHAYMDATTGKPCRAPEFFLERIKDKF